MKSKKITAWILFMAMLVTMMPTTVLGALADEYYPIIITDVFSEMTNDIDGVQHGTDLDLVGATNEILPDFKNISDVLTDTLEGVSGTVLHKADKDTNSADGVVKLAPMRRKQILTFVAESHADNAELRKFVDEGTSTGISAGAVEIAYLDADKAPLKVNVESEEGKDFVVGEATTWDEAWIDLTTDVQRTNVNLKTFLNPDPSEPQYDLRDTTKTTLINTKKLTAADLFATGDKISFIIYNAIRGDFSGYIRVKIKDNAGYTTVQDYAIVADGQYPSISIKTSTHKDNVGEYTMVPDALDPTKLVATTVANNTFIAEDDFATIMEDTADNKAENEMDNLKKSYRWKKLDSDSLNATLKDIAEGKDSEYEGKTYDSEKIWAMDEIVIDKIAVSDELITSEIDTVKYTLKTFTNDEITDVVGSSIEGTTDLTFEPDALATGKVWNITSTPIVVSDEGFNVLAITATDKAGLKTTSRYYFYIDTVEPEAELSLVELDKNVISLLTVADVVTNRQQAVDIEATDLVGSDNVKVVSGVEEAVEGEENLMYQYRLLATKAGEAAKDTDGDGVDDVPADYTDVVVDKKGNDLSGWKIWTGETETPVIDKEFDGIVQVRVQDRAGNWSPIVSTTSDGKETIITDNTNPVIDVKEYALNSNSDTTGNTVDEIINGTASDILVTTARVTEKTDGEIENEVIHTTTGDVAPWINDSAVLEVKVTDEDLANEIRSSGLNKGHINVKAEFNAENENKKIKIWNKNGVDKKNIDDSFNLTEDYIFGTETDKDLTFYIEYEGTGVVDITVSVKDQADVNDGDVFSSIYKTQLRVDKINPYIIYKGYDITDDAEKDLLKANNEKVDYEVRNMPWGPNSQVLEVVVKDDDITPVQSKTKNVKFNADKALDLYKISGDTFTKVKTYAAGNNNIVSLGDCEELANEKYESNVGYKFYLVYEGTGIAKVEFFADDSAKEPNVRDYPSVATAADAEPVLYDAMLRVDKINPEIKNAKLVETETDVADKGWSLFSFNETDADVNTRKQMKITFEIVDETTTAEQSGVNIQNEKISGVDLIDVYDKYVEKDKTHLYDNEATAYITDDANDVAVDPNIDYILLPVESGSINGTGGTFTQAASASNEDIEALVAKYLDKEYNADGDKCEWKKAAWKDGGIVVPDEFQGAIVLRTIDRVGNIDYSEPITFVAESREALIDFEPQNGYIWSQNNYGWSKRDYDYVEIRVKDDNEEKVDAWLENVFISVTDLEGNDISTKDTVKFAHKIHADDASLEVDPSAYTYVSLSDFTNEAAYGYDVIDNDGLVEKLARDTEGYIHLGYVRVSESAQIKVTVFDKAKADNVEYTGNKTTGVWTSRIDRIAPTVNVKVVAIPEGEYVPADNNKVVLGLKADIIDSESGVAPAITDDTYNVYTPENVPATGVFASDKSFLYKVTNDADVEIERFNKGTFNTKQYELPGLQYALIPENGDLEDVAPWIFNEDPEVRYDKDGYYIGTEEQREKKTYGRGATNVWHNYIDDKTPILPEEGFDGYVVVRAIDKAGNITVIGCAPTIDIEAAEGWQKETQFIQVKASAKTGNITKIEYSGNNNLLTHDEEGNVTTRDISAEAASGEGAFIEVAEEGITDVIITASEEYATQQIVKAKANVADESKVRNANYEGEMVIGNATTAGYEDFKFQTIQVKIDKTAPTFEFTLVDDLNNEILTLAPKGFAIVTKEDAEITDPIPNLPDVVGYRSHTPSGIAKVEYCVANEGMEEWIEVDKATWETGVIKAYADNEAITGTVKVRVTDNAGNITEKSKSINIDSATPIISISKSYDEKYSHEPVDVFVTVSKSAEFSDIKSVTYTVTKDGKEVEDFYHKDSNGNRKNELPLTGGTISIDKSGDYTITVIATNKADVSVSKEISVKVHLEDLTMPILKDTVSGEWKKTADNKVAVVADAEDKVRYSKNGSQWAELDLAADESIELSAGENTIRIQAFRDCGCESDVNTYIINYDNGVAPKISVIYDDNSDTYWHKDTADASIIANVGDSVSEIRSITYQLGSGTATDDEYYLGKEGGTIILQEEGSWEVSKIVVKMESGITYYLNESKELVAFTGDIPSDYWKKVVARIDRTAPSVEASLKDGSDVATLFGITGEVDHRKKKDLTITVKDFDDHGCSFVKSVEYAIVEKGAQPEWIPIAPFTEGVPVTVENAINKAFDGTVMVRAIDNAGNETVLTRNIFTEGIDPEISITAPYGWQKQAATITIDVFDKGMSSEINYVEYTLKKKIGGTWSEVGTMSGSTKTGEDNPAKLTSRGGQISISNDGEYEIVVTAYDYAGNSGTQSVEVKVDRTAPTYSGSVSLSLYNVHNIAESNWNTIHDGWTYNHAVSLAGVTDATSGLKKVDVKFTNAKGETTSTTFGAHQTGAEFTASGKYDLTLTDNAGNVRNIGFTIDETLENVINVVGVDEVGKLQIAVTDGDDMLTFYKKENSESKYTKMYNGITDQLVDGKTGVRYIYGQNDSGKKSNTLYVIVAPSTEYGISLMSLNATPNRYLNIDAEGGNVTVKKIDEIFNPGINKNISVGSVVEINEDGVYSITTND